MPEACRSTEDGFIHREGTRLFYRRIPSAGPPRARVASVHGFGEHGSLPNYRMLAEALSQRGIEVWQLDLRGHGRSDGQRGHVDRWEEFREDLAAFLGLIETGLPLHLCGLSMGGLMVLDYALARPEGLSSVISVVPPVGKIGIPAWLQSLGSLVSKRWPRFSMDSRLRKKNISRDNALLDAYARDPMFHLRGSARLLTEILQSSARVREGGAEFRVPLLLLLAGADRICPRDDTFFNSVNGPRKRMRVYEGARHNLFLETNRNEVFADIAEWVLGGGE